MRKQKRRKSVSTKIFDSLYVIVGTILLVAGLSLFFFNSKVGRAYMLRDNGERASENLTAKQADKNRKVKTTYDASKTTDVDTRQLWDARKTPAGAIGRMSIPAADIHNPLFQGYGAQLQNLSYGVCTVVPNRVMGGTNNYVVAGHYMGNYGPAVLDNLHLTRAGDKIYFTDMHRIYEYVETNMRYDITPKQVEVENNIPGKKTVTLITCSDFNVNQYGYGQHRTVAVGEFIGSMPATKKNLENTELTNKVSPKISQKHVRYKVVKSQPKSAKIYSSLSLKQIIFWPAVIIGVIVVICLLKIWL